MNIKDLLTRAYVKPAVEDIETCDNKILSSTSCHYAGQILTIGK